MEHQDLLKNNLELEREIEELREDNRYLAWYINQVHFDPEDRNKVISFQLQYEKETGNKVPSKWRVIKFLKNGDEDSE